MSETDEVTPADVEAEVAPAPAVEEETPTPAAATSPAAAVEVEMTPTVSTEEKPAAAVAAEAATEEPTAAPAATTTVAVVAAAPVDIGTLWIGMPVLVDRNGGALPEGTVRDVVIASIDDSARTVTVTASHSDAENAAPETVAFASLRHREVKDMGQMDFVKAYGVQAFLISWVKSFWDPMQYFTEVLSGLTVSFALVPEAVSFAMIAGLPATVGLFAAFWIGFIASLFGGRPGMISGATGSMAAVMPPYVKKHCANVNEVNGQCDSDDFGAQFIYLSVIFAGFFQIIAGLINIPALLRLLPHTAMLGFVNGLAIVIGYAQLEFFEVDHHWVEGEVALFMAIEVLLSIAVQVFWGPYITDKLPAPLIALALVTAFHFIPFWGNTPTVGSFSKTGGGNGISGSFPAPHLPYLCATPSVGANATYPGHCQGYDAYSWEVVGEAANLGLILAAIGLIESLMTLQLVDEITETEGSPIQECAGQGLANIMSGLFQSMGGCAMIGQTMINIHNGSKLRFSGVVAAVVLLVIVLALPPLIEVIPLGGLVGVMAMVVIHTFEWKSFSLILILPIADTCIVIVVTALAVLTNLAYAVVAGIVLQAVVFSWSNSGRVKLTDRTLSVSADGATATVTYTIEGPLFFASVAHFKKIFANLRGEPGRIVVHLENLRVYDSSGLVALNDMAARFVQLEKKAVVYMSPETRSTLDPSAEVLTDITFLSATPRALNFPYALPRGFGGGVLPQAATDRLDALGEQMEPGMRTFRQTYCNLYSQFVKWTCQILCHAPLGLRQKVCYASWRALCCVSCIWEKPCVAESAPATAIHGLWKALCWNVWIESSCGPPPPSDDNHPVLAFDADGEWIGAEIAGSDVWEKGFALRSQNAGYAYIDASDASPATVVMTATSEVAVEDAAKAGAPTSTV